MTHRSDRRRPFTIRFADPRLEEAYERDLGAADRRRLRVASVSAIAIWAVAALVGPPLLGIDRVPVAIGAITVSGMNLVSLTLLHSRPTTLRTQRRLLVVINMTSVVAILVVITTSGVPSSIAAPSVILNFMFALPQRIALPAAMLVGVFHVLAYGVFAAWVREGPDVVFSTFLVASAVAIGLIAIRLLEDSERSSYAQARVVTDLHRRVDRLLHQYLSPDVAQVLIDDPGRADLGGEAVDVTVLFADLQDFTPFSERTPPADVVAMLNAAFGEAVPAIFAEGGTIIQFAGDAVVAVFNAPVRQHDHALRAGRAALALQASTARLSAAGAGLKGSISPIRGLRHREHALSSPGRSSMLFWLVYFPGAPSPRSRRSPSRRAGHRAPGAPAPGAGAAAAGEAPSTQPSRPGPVGGGKQGDDEEQLVLVRGAARDPAAAGIGNSSGSSGHRGGRVTLAETSSSASAGNIHGGGTSACAGS